MKAESKVKSSTPPIALFVSGICKVKDADITSYFKKFGSLIESFHVERERKSAPCCFALITFTSCHTAGAIMRHRPHKIQASSLYVKRTDLRDTTPLPERYLPANILIISFKPNAPENENLLRETVRSFGVLVNYRKDPINKVYVIEYQDYDSVDEFCFKLSHSKLAINVNRSLQNDKSFDIIYMGSCTGSYQTDVLKQQKTRKPDQPEIVLPKETECSTDNEQINSQVEQLASQLDKALKEVEKANADRENQQELKKLLEKECEDLRVRNSELEKLLQQKEIAEHICSSCELQQITITSLQMSLCRMKHSYERLKFDYERLLSRERQTNEHSRTNCQTVQQPIRKSISARINNSKDHKQKLSNDQLFESEEQYSCQPRIVVQQMNTKASSVNGSYSHED